MSNVIFQYNQDSAMKAGSAGVQTGADIFTIESAEYRNYQNNLSLNLTVVTDSGAKTFVDLRYQSSDGKAWNGNINHINAIQGLTNVMQLTSAQNGDSYFAPELAGKKVGLVLQKRLYTKGDNSDGSSMSLIMAFNAQTRCTLKEQVEGKQAETVSKIVETLEDKDDRKKQMASQSQQQGGYNDMPDYGQF